MIELRRTNDLVYLSWARAVLQAEGIATLLLDDHVSNVEGSIGAIPRRLMVPPGSSDRAREVLSRAEAELENAPAGDSRERE